MYLIKQTFCLCKLPPSIEYSVLYWPKTRCSVLSSALLPHEMQTLGSWVEETVPAEKLSNFGFDLSCVSVRLA